MKNKRTTISPAVTRSLEAVFIPAGLSRCDVAGATSSYVRSRNGDRHAILVSSLQVTPIVERLSIKVAAAISSVEEVLEPLRRGWEHIQADRFTVACPIYMRRTDLPQFWLVKKEQQENQLADEIADATRSVAFPYFEMASSIVAFQQELVRDSTKVAGHANEVQRIAVTLAASKVINDRRTIVRLTKRLSEMPQQEWVLLKKVREWAESL